MRRSWIELFLLILLAPGVAVPHVFGQSKPTVNQTTLEEPDQRTPEISTEELKKILATKSEPVLDVRSADEFAIAHIPGSVNVYEKELERVVQVFPDKTSRFVLYCNGPFCGKSKRLSERLVKLGYTNVRRYQLGLPVWRALGNIVQTDLEGFRYVITKDRTAVFVDARSDAEFKKETIPGAVNVRPGEAEKANEDGRLPYRDKGTRVIVFANSPAEARVVAAEIARKAYWNSSYFGGTFADLKRLVFGSCAAATNLAQDALLLCIPRSLPAEYREKADKERNHKNDGEKYGAQPCVLCAASKGTSAGDEVLVRRSHDDGASKSKAKNQSSWLFVYYSLRRPV